MKRSSPNRQPKPNSPVLKSYLGNSGPCSPYREPVSFLRDQLNRNKQQEDEQGKYIKRMNVFRNRQTRPVSKQEYERLMVKTHVKEREDVAKDIVIPRWPESEKHIAGGISLRPESPKANRWTENDVVEDDYYDMMDFHGEERSGTYYHYEADEGRHIGNSGPNAQRKLGEEFDNIIYSHHHQGQHNFNHGVSRDEIEKFNLTKEEIDRISLIRAQLLSALAHTNSHLGIKDESVHIPRKESSSETLHHFSPPPKDRLGNIGAQVDLENMYSPDEQVMFKYATDNPIINEYPPEFQHQHPLYPISLSEFHDGIHQEHILESPVRIHQSSVLPERRMSPMELKRFRIKNGEFDPDQYFNNRVSTSVIQPHPEIKGQFTIPTDVLSRVSDLKDDRVENANDSILQDNRKIAMPPLSSADASTVLQQKTINNSQSASGSSIHEVITNNPSENIAVVNPVHVVAMSNTAQIQNPTDFERVMVIEQSSQAQDPVPKRMLPTKISFLEELKLKALKPTLKKCPPGDKKSSTEVSIDERQKIFTKQQEDRYFRFRHSMLMHHICEYSSERFEREILLGRGKFAAVYSVHKQQPIQILMNDEICDGDIDGTKRLNNTVFRCLVQNGSASTHDKQKVKGALKIAQFKGNENQNVLPPLSVLDEFERELIALKDLQNHPNIVSLFGYLSQPFSIIMELIDGDNLFSCINDVTWQQGVSAGSRLSLATCIVEGLKFMHQKRYMHRDVKPHNILVSSVNGCLFAKIADLGTAVKLTFDADTDNVSENMLLHDAVGTSGYTAPEILDPQGSSYYYPADVFSFGIVLWELFYQIEKTEDLQTRCNPLSGLHPNEAYEMILTGCRPSCNENKMTNIIESILPGLWSTDPALRIKMANIGHHLDAFRDTVSDGPL